MTRTRTWLYRIAASTVLASTASWAAAPSDPRLAQPIAGDIEMRNWTVDAESFTRQLSASRAKGGLKSATDVAAVYRPIAVCRLIDTRGFPAAIAVAGPLQPNTSTNISAAGSCGIPNNGLVAALSVSFHVQNLTPNNGGYISFLQQGAPIAGTNAVFAPGQQWIAATANVSVPNDTGNFMIYVNSSQVQVVVDINGYYQDMDSVDIGTQEIDYFGNAIGNMFELSNTGTGSTLALNATGGGPALTVFSGGIRAAGAGLNTNTFAAIHQVSTAGNFGAGGTLCDATFPNFSVIDNPQANGNPNAIVMLTPRVSGGSLGPNVNYEAFYYPGGSCVAAAAGHWMAHRLDNSPHQNGVQFSVLVIRP